MADAMTNVRTERIDAAVCAGSELVAALRDHGTVTPAQAKLIIESAIRAAVPNFESWEVRAAAMRIAGELAGSDSEHNQTS